MVNVHGSEDELDIFRPGSCGDGACFMQLPQGFCGLSKVQVVVVVLVQPMECFSKLVGIEPKAFVVVVNLVVPV